MTEQGYPPRQPGHSGYPGHQGHPGRPGRPRPTQEPRHNGWQMLDAFEPAPDLDSDLPPWAIPGGIEPMKPARRPVRTVQADPVEPPEIVAAEPRAVRPRDGDSRRPGRGRAAATRRRRSRRRLVTWGSVAAVAAIVAVAVHYLTQPSAPADPYVTALQKGEFSNVPNACKIISPSALSTYLNGRPSKTVQTFAAATKSECTFEVDAKPVFRELDITDEAYTPSLIAPGNGSATSYARYTFAQTRQELATPPKNSAQPPATIKPLSGLGSEALSAVQLYRQPSKIDRITVLVRVHNVLITVYLWASVGRGFSPVSIPRLQAYAEAAARTSAAAVTRRSAVG